MTDAVIVSTAGPVFAVLKLLAKAGLRIEDIGFDT